MVTALPGASAALPLAASEASIMFPVTQRQVSLSHAVLAASVIPNSSQVVPPACAGSSGS